MSTELSLAKEPKRARGKQRVADLLDAAAALFAENGYEATTTAAIAARAGASIGSLYQFFPSKQSLAEALFARYRERASQALTDVVSRAPGQTPAQIADMLVRLMLDLKADRDTAVVLSEAIAEVVDRRKSLRGALRKELAAILRSANPRLTSKRAAVAAVMIAQMMKTVPALTQEDKTQQAALLAGLREMLTLYITHIINA